MADFALQGGELQARALLLDTTSDIISGGGTSQSGACGEPGHDQIRTEAEHFNHRLDRRRRFPLPAARCTTSPAHCLNITKLAVRGGAAAAGLGLLFPPAAISPTIQSASATITVARR